jgi:hypothetical protein
MGEGHGDTLHVASVFPPLVLVSANECRLGRQVEAKPRQRRVRQKRAYAVDRDSVEVFDPTDIACQHRETAKERLRTEDTAVVTLVVREGAGEVGGGEGVPQLDGRPISQPLGNGGLDSDDACATEIQTANA